MEERKRFWPELCAHLLGCCAYRCCRVLGDSISALPLPFMLIGLAALRSQPKHGRPQRATMTPSPMTRRCRTCCWVTWRPSTCRAAPGSRTTTRVGYLV